MDEEEYIQTQCTILNLVEIVKDLPLQEFIAAIDRADTVGPILDPSLWMRGNKKMNEIRRLAIGLQKFQSAIHELQKG